MPTGKYIRTHQNCPLRRNQVGVLLMLRRKKKGLSVNEICKELAPLGWTVRTMVKDCLVSLRERGLVRKASGAWQATAQGIAEAERQQRVELASARVRVAARRPQANKPTPTIQEVQRMVDGAMRTVKVYPRGFEPGDAAPCKEGADYETRPR